MSNDNVFSPLPGPEATTEGFQFDRLLVDQPGELHLEGDLVVTPLNASWPPYCVRCGAAVPASDFVLKTSWVPRWVIVLFVLIRWLGIIVYFATRTRLQLNVGLCEEHRTRRSRMMWGGAGGMVAAAIGCCGSVGEDSAALLIFFGAVAFASLVVLVVGARLVAVKKVDQGMAWVKVKLPFVDAVRRDGAIPAGP